MQHDVTLLVLGWPRALRYVRSDQQRKTRLFVCVLLLTLYSTKVKRLGTTHLDKSIVTLLTDGGERTADRKRIYLTETRVSTGQSGPRSTLATCVLVPMSSQFVSQVTNHLACCCWITAEAEGQAPALTRPNRQPAGQ